MPEFKWTRRLEEAARLVADDSLSDEEIAAGNADRFFLDDLEIVIIAGCLTPVAAFAMGLLITHSFSPRYASPSIIGYCLGRRNEWPPGYTVTVSPCHLVTLSLCQPLTGLAQ